MSNHKIRLTKCTFLTSRLRSGVLGIICLLALGASGCMTEPEIKQDSDQEVLGLGIVLGTRGYQEVQKDLASPGAFSLALEGQVIKIEGAAYVVKEITQQERRIPIDQNTTIDHPAHIGDWIAAYLDSHGRAIHIRNIDEEFMAREGPVE